MICRTTRYKFERKYAYGARKRFVVRTLVRNLERTKVRTLDPILSFSAIARNGPIMVF